MSSPPELPHGIWKRFKFLINNTISYMGLAGMACFALVILFRIFLDVTGSVRDENPYSSLVTYILLPALFWGSATFAGLGMFLKYRRSTHPSLRFLSARQLRMRHYTAIATGVLVTLAWLFLTGFGTYNAYHYTDSNNFCGLACHQVMIPEYTAYMQSPHARVNCVDCHIGPGASWFVKAKITGMHQLYAVTFHTYHTPIKTPIHDLRPAQDTCEQCHWPGRFSGAMERVITHYAKDKANTPTRLKLLMKVGGGDSKPGQARGIHWHVSKDSTVEYLPLDEQRQDIPYVRVTYHADGHREEFFAPDFDRSKVNESQLRKMDCLDCHNRPSHIFKSPNRALDEALDKGLVSPTLPDIKRIALDLFTGQYQTQDEAKAAIDAALDAYPKDHPLTPAQQPLLDQARQALKEVYGTYFFPEQGVDYRAFIDNTGHRDYIGCERCHDTKHKTADGKKAITKDCNSCHDLIGQATGVEEVTKMTYGSVEFEHPNGDINPNWNCSKCHALNKEKQ